MRSAVTWKALWTDGVNGLACRAQSAVVGSDQPGCHAMAVFLHRPTPVADGHEVPFTAVIR
jgi:hypothetical protein